MGGGGGGGGQGRRGRRGGGDVKAYGHSYLAQFAADVAEEGDAFGHGLDRDEAVVKEYLDIAASSGEQLLVNLHVREVVGEGLLFSQPLLLLVSGRVPQVYFRDPVFLREGQYPVFPS